MADIIRLRCSPHEQTQTLLPWYANGTLEPEEIALVEAHLADCTDCQSELEFARILAPRVASLPVDTDRGWIELARRLDEWPSQGAPKSFFQRPIALGWAVSAQLAAATLLIGVFTSLPAERPGQTYRALGAQPADPSGNVLIMFRPEVSERRMRVALLQTDARLVDGPNTTGAYVLRVAPASRTEALERLRRMPDVLLAQPVDAAN